MVKPKNGNSKIGVGVFQYTVSTLRRKISILFSIFYKYFNYLSDIAGEHSSGSGQTEAEQQISRHVAGVGEKDDFWTRLHCGKVTDSHRECTTYKRNITRQLASCQRKNASKLLASTPLKKLFDIPVPSLDVFYQTLPGRNNLYMTS